MWHLRETGEMHAGCLYTDLRKRDYIEDLGISWREILKWIFKKCDVQAWIGLVGLRTGTGGSCL